MHPCRASAGRTARGCAAGRRSRDGPETANCQFRVWRERDGLMKKSIRADMRNGSKRPRNTYGGSPFRLRETRSRRNRPGNRLLSQTFSQSLGGRLPVDGREEGTNPSSPEPFALGFREMGMSNQECLAISGDGPREEFIIGVIGGHGGKEYQDSRRDRAVY